MYILSSVSSMYAMLRKSPKALNIAYRCSPRSHSSGMVRISLLFIAMNIKSPEII